MRTTTEEQKSRRDQNDKEKKKSVSSTVLCNIIERLFNHIITEAINLEERNVGVREVEERKKIRTKKRYKNKLEAEEKAYIYKGKRGKRRMYITLYHANHENIGVISQ